MILAPGTPRRAWFAGLLVLVGTFLAGTLVGAAATRVVVAREAPAAAPAQPAPERTRGEDRRDRDPDLFERLSLTPEQKLVVDSILEYRRGQMRAVWSESRPRMKAILDSTRTEIRALLTPEQLVIEEQIHAERQKHHRRRDRDDSKSTKGDVP